MNGIYHNIDNAEIGKLSGPTLVGHNIDTAIAEKYDKLNAEEFKEVVMFIMSHYKTARNRKNTSGQHEHDFGKFVEGKSWLLYFHNVIESIGDRALCDCAYAELDDDVKIVSDKTVVDFTPKVVRSTSRRSPSPTLSTQSFSRNSLIEAKKAVSDSIARKNSEALLIGQYSRMAEVRATIFDSKGNLAKIKAAVTEIKEKLKNASGKSSKDMNELRECAKKALLKKKNCKSHLLQAETEYESLKKKTFYESDDGEDSDSDILNM